MGVWGSGGGCEYSCRGSLLFRDSKSRFVGKKGNLSVNIWMVRGPMLSWMNV